MRCAIYARAATRAECEKQLDDLRGYVDRRAWQIGKEYVEVGTSRLQLARLMSDAKRPEIDCVLVWKLDRWGRNLTNCLASIDELRQRGIRWIAVGQGIDTDTLLPLIGALLEFGSEMKRERVKAGMRAAERHGAYIGRPKRIFARDKVAEMHAAGDSVRSIAKKLGVSVGTVHGLLAVQKGWFDLANRADEPKDLGGGFGCTENFSFPHGKMR